MKILDVAITSVEMTKDYATMEIISVLSNLASQIKTARDALSKGERMPTLMLQNATQFEGAVARYNLIRELLPSLREAQRVDSPHERQHAPRGKRDGSGGEPDRAERGPGTGEGLPLRADGPGEHAPGSAGDPGKAVLKLPRRKGSNRGSGEGPNK